MEDKANILKELQHLEVQPPGGLYSDIWKVISGESSIQTPAPIPETETTTPETGIIELDIPVQFRQLKDYVDQDAQPPGFEEIFQSDKNTRQSKDPVPIKYNWRKFAAIFVLVLAAGIALVVYNNKRNQADDSQVNHLISHKNASDSSSLNDHAKNHGNDRKKVNRDDIEVSAKASIHISKNVNAPFINADFIYLLTNFNPETAELFLQDIAGKSVLYLNRFSYVNISDKMQEFLQTMYKTKHNKKPTRKARKAKQKLEKWKQSDENYFDNGANKNPLDIIDLSEFILK